jgi:E3 ubiquitin-protein ligase listerin
MKLIPEIIRADQELLVQNNSKYRDEDVVPSDWHKLDLFKSTLEECHIEIDKNVDISSLRFSEIDDATKIPPAIALTYLLSWNCILSICADSPLDLRSVYINWISTFRFHEKFFAALFDMMPRKVVKSPDMCTQLGFSSFSPNEPEMEEVNLERFSSFLYSKALRVIPVLARKWWNGIDSKVAHLVDKITTIYISPALCAEELNALISKKDKDGNMNIRVLMNSREVIATYGIENAKMELQLKLANNHPLGVIKVESKKHIGGKLQGFEIVKQLSIYLSHQNGRLSDGINLWKRNLDKKYEGVEECFICYSVVQMENLQLPKLSCKACKKKFHCELSFKFNFHTN